METAAQRLQKLDSIIAQIEILTVPSNKAQMFNQFSIPQQQIYQNPNTFQNIVVPVQQDVIRQQNIPQTKQKQQKIKKNEIKNQDNESSDEFEEHLEILRRASKKSPKKKSKETKKPIKQPKKYESSSDEEEDSDNITETILKVGYNFAPKNKYPARKKIPDSVAIQPSGNKKKSSLPFSQEQQLFQKIQAAMANQVADKKETIESEEIKPQKTDKQKKAKKGENPEGQKKLADRLKNERLQQEKKRKENLQKNKQTFKEEATDYEEEEEEMKIIPSKPTNYKPIKKQEIIRNKPIKVEEEESYDEIKQIIPSKKENGYLDLHRKRLQMQKEAEQRERIKTKKNNLVSIPKTPKYEKDNEEEEEEKQIIKSVPKKKTMIPVRPKKTNIISESSDSENLDDYMPGVKKLSLSDDSELMSEDSFEKKPMRIQTKKDFVKQQIDEEESSDDPLKTPVSVKSKPKFDEDEEESEISLKQMPLSEQEESEDEQMPAINKVNQFNEEEEEIGFIQNKQQEKQVESDYSEEDIETKPVRKQLNKSSEYEEEENNTKNEQQEHNNLSFSENEEEEKTIQSNENKKKEVSSVDNEIEDDKDLIKQVDKQKHISFIDNEEEEEEENINYHNIVPNEEKELINNQEDIEEEESVISNSQNGNSPSMKELPTKKIIEFEEDEEDNENIRKINTNNKKILPVFAEEEEEEDYSIIKDKQKLLPVPKQTQKLSNSYSEDDLAINKKDAESSKQNTIKSQNESMSHSLDHYKSSTMQESIHSEENEESEDEQIQQTNNKSELYSSETPFIKHDNQQHDKDTSNEESNDDLVSENEETLPKTIPNSSMEQKKSTNKTEMSRKSLQSFIETELNALKEIQKEKEAEKANKDIMNASSSYFYTYGEEEEDIIEEKKPEESTSKKEEKKSYRPPIVDKVFQNIANMTGLKNTQTSGSENKHITFTEEPETKSMDDDQEEEASTDSIAKSEDFKVPQIQTQKEDLFSTSELASQSSTPNPTPSPLKSPEKSPFNESLSQSSLSRTETGKSLRNSPLRKGFDLTSLKKEDYTQQEIQKPKISSSLNDSLRDSLKSKKEDSESSIAMIKPVDDEEDSSSLGFSLSDSEEGNKENEINKEKSIDELGLSVVDSNSLMESVRKSLQFKSHQIDDKNKPINEYTTTSDIDLKTNRFWEKNTEENDETYDTELRTKPLVRQDTTKDVELEANEIKQNKSDLFDETDEESSSKQRKESKFLQETNNMSLSSSIEPKKYNESVLQQTEEDNSHESNQSKKSKYLQDTENISQSIKSEKSKESFSRQSKQKSPLSNNKSNLFDDTYENSIDSTSSNQSRKSKFLQETLPEENLTNTSNSKHHEALKEEDVSNIHLSQSNGLNEEYLNESLKSNSSKQSRQSRFLQDTDEHNKKQSTFSPLANSIPKESLFDDSDSLTLTQNSGKALDESPIVDSGSSQRKYSSSSQKLSTSGGTLTDANESIKKDPFSISIRQDDVKKSLSLGLSLDEEDKEKASETDTIMLNTHKPNPKTDSLTMTDTNTLMETTNGIVKPLVKKEILSDESDSILSDNEKINSLHKQEEPSDENDSVLSSNIEESVVKEEKIEEVGDLSPEEEDDSGLFSLNQSLKEQSDHKKESGELSTLVDPTIQSTLLKPIAKQQESLGLSFSESTEVTEVQQKTEAKNVNKSISRLSSTRPSTEAKFSSLETTDSTVSDYVPTKNEVTTQKSIKKSELIEPSHISDDEEFTMTDNNPIPHVSSTSDSILHDEILGSSTLLGTKESNKIQKPEHIDDGDIPQKDQSAAKRSKTNGIRVSFHPDFLPHPKQESNLFSNASGESSDVHESLSIPPSERLRRYNEEHSQLSTMSQSEKSKAIIEEYEEKSKGGSGNEFDKLTIEEDHILRIILPQAVNMETHQIYEAVANEMGTQRTNPSVIRIVANICRYFDIPMERINPLEVTSTFDPKITEEESDDDYF